MNEQHIYNEVDKGRTRICVLCLVGVPGGTGDTSGGYNHIVPRGRLPGKGNENLLWALVNICLSCLKHHELFGHEPLIWQRAMAKLRYAKPEDYLVYGYWSDEPDPRLGECIGKFGYGDKIYEMGIPRSIQKAFFGTEDRRITSFCAACCPWAGDCIEATRANLRLELKKDDRTYPR